MQRSYIVATEETKLVLVYIERLKSPHC